MNSGTHSSKTAIIHKAKVLNNHCSPCPTADMFEKPKQVKFKDQTFTLVKKWKKIHTGNHLYFQTSSTHECKLYRERCQGRIWKQTRTLQIYAVIWASFVCFACRFLGSASGMAWQKRQLNLWLARFNDVFIYQKNMSLAYTRTWHNIDTYGKSMFTKMTQFGTWILRPLEYAIMFIMLFQHQNFNMTLKTDISLRNI